MALNEPEYSRVEFWINLQKDSGWSKAVFLKKLTDSYKHYFSIIDNEVKKLNSWGNDVTDHWLPLVYETDWEMKGHFGKKELLELASAIIELSKKFNLKWDDSYYENISDSAKGAIKEIIDTNESDEYKLRQLKALKERLNKSVLEPFNQIYELSKDAKFLVDISQAQNADHLILKEIIKLETTDGKSDEKIEIQPIHWLKGEESLRLFLDSLKSADLIESKDTNNLILEHFYVDGQKPTKEPNPINWIKSKVLLAYLIKELSTKPSMHEPFIEPDKKWQLTELHFTVKGKEVGRSLVNDIKQSRFPNGCEEIDKILKRLTKH